MQYSPELQNFVGIPIADTAGQFYPWLILGRGDSMKIAFHGFRIYAGDGITLPEFGAILTSASSGKTEHLFNDHNRLFLFEDRTDPEFYTGLLITAKDQKTFPQLRDERGNLSIRISALAQGSRLMDFNFFVLNKTTFCGIYQDYHFSLSLPQFGIFLKDRFWRPEQDVRITAKTREYMAHGGWDPVHAEAMAKKEIQEKHEIRSIFQTR